MPVIVRHLMGQLTASWFSIGDTFPLFKVGDTDLSEVLEAFAGKQVSIRIETSD